MNLSPQKIEINELIQLRIATRTRAERLIEELSWRLFPSGGPEHINLEKTEQAWLELRAAILDIKRATDRINNFPPEIRPPDAEERGPRRP